MIVGIYVIVNEVTFDRYVGSSTDVFSRWESHRYDLERNQHINPKLQNAWNKYGAENFRFVIQEDVGEQFEFEIDRDSLLEVEQWYLDNWQTHYNINRTAASPPNAAGRIKNRESVERQVAIRRSRDNYRVSEETRQKIREARIKQNNTNTSGFQRGWELNQLKKSARVQVICERCKTSFELPPSQARGRRFCSATCQHNRGAPTC